MAKTWEDDWAPLVHADIASCPYPTVVAAVRQAAIEFFEKTRCWVVDLTAINIVALTQTYALTSNVSGTTVIAPRQVIWGIAGDTSSKVLLPRTLAWLQDRYGDISQGDGDPAYYLSDGPRSVTLVPNPSSALTAGLRIKAAIKPTQASSGVDDDEQFEEYHQDIVYGARARILSMSKKDWTDQVVARDEQNEFMSRIARVRKRAAQQWVRAPLRGNALFF